MAETARAYKAKPQISRALSEEWCAREMYCPACDSDHLSQMPANTPSIDFSCGHCGELFQLKSSKSPNPKKIVDAGYEAMIRTIRADRTPNLLLLHHSTDWIVTGLVLIPRVFFTERVIEKRKPLSLSARRAGWVGCNILIREIPKDGKIDVVAEGTVLPPNRVRQEFSRARRLAELPPQMRGWTIDVLSIIRKLGMTKFSLSDMYQFEAELKYAHPQNRHVRPKIRQQLQILRDLGLIRFETPGQYSIV